MNYVKCPHDHYYDGDKYSSCPFCGGESTLEETATIFQTGDDQVTAPLGAGIVAPTVPLDFGAPGVTVPLEEDDDDQKTVFLDEDTNGNAPVVGWLVALTGSHKGKDFRLEAGRNCIGRGPDMDVALIGETSVSRDKHAIIVYEPVQNIFLAVPGDARELFYLNGKVVLTPQEIKKGDRLSVGQVELMFIPCCDEGFNWG